MPAPETTCQEWQASANSAGYGVWWDGTRTRAAHRMAYELEYGTIPNGMVVMHSCDNRKCINPDHLSVGTQGDNLRDMTDKGRHGHTVLTDDEVKDIRELLESGEYTSQREIAKQYGVSESLISGIKLRHYRNKRQGEHSVQPS